MTRRMTTRQGMESAEDPFSRMSAVRLWPDVLARAWTRQVVEAALRDEQIVAIVASGSAVRDVQQSDDLDLVLVYAECRPGLPRPPISIDLRQYDEQDVPAKLKQGHDYLWWTLRYGQVLFEREGWWTKLREDRIGEVPLPSVDQAKERAREAERLYNELCAAGDQDAAADLQLSLLTHLARAALSQAQVFPKSRPELADQLREIGEQALADRLAEALAHRNG